MSRSHLYRASGPARPLASIVLAALWCGAALSVLLAAGPLLLGGVPLNGPVAALVERSFSVIAGGGVLAGIGIVGAELFSGRTMGRWLRLIGALLLLLSSGAGLVQGFRHLLRPGTPIPAATPEPSMGSATDGIHATERFGWPVVGLAGSFLVLGAGLVALRSSPRAQ